VRRFASGFLVGLAAVGLLAVLQVPTAGVPAPAAASPVDQTPPVLTVPVKPAFVVGDILAYDESCTFEGVGFTSNIDQSIRWSATDNVGVWDYDLYEVPYDREPEPILQHSQSTQYTYGAGSDYDSTCGGGTSAMRFWVTARDQSFNATTKVVWPMIAVTEEDNASPTGAAGQFTYSGTWGIANCTCFLGGHTRRTSAYGARAMFTATYNQGDHVALVMAKGPGRGRASIRVDGVQVATIDTYAAANTNRVVVFERRMMSAGTHTLTIVNLATAGRPRIDVDAVITN
jgi:hypothetical protein